MPLFRLSAVALLALVLGAGPAAAQSLFLEETGRSVAADAAAAPVARSLRQRDVLLNLGVAAGLTSGRSAQPTLELDLFPGVTVSATPERQSTAANGATIWTGGVSGDRFGHAVLVVNGADVTGSVIANNQVFEIRPLGQGRHRIVEIDQQAFPDEHNDFREDPAAPTPLPMPKASTTGKAVSGFGRATTSATRVTLLALYTPEAKAASYNIVDELGLAVAVTNQAYARSGMAVQLDLVGIRQFTGVTDNGDLDTILNTITGNSTIEGWRNTAQADLVTLVSEVSDAYCGLAWLTPGAASAYSSIVRSCAISNLSFPHEIGHNLGARHDRYVDPSSSTTAYNFGYVDSSARVRTIMAYNNACSDAGFNCTRVGYFSSPTVTLNGRPLGVALGAGLATDNARAIWGRSQVATDFRSGTPPTLVIPQTGMWWNTAQGGRGYAIEFYPDTGNLFFGGFLYNTDGSSTWYVSTCALTGGTCTGSLAAYAGGSTLTSSTASGVGQTGTVGQIALAFSDSKNGTMTWPGGTVGLTRYPLDGTDGSLSPDLNGSVQNGWYYSTSEGGSGWFFETQSATPNQMFALAYMYNSAGRPTWYLATGGMTNTTTFEGRLTEYAGGGSLTSAATPPTSTVDRGAVTVRFSTNRTARVTLPTRSLTLTRYGT